MKQLRTAPRGVQGRGGSRGASRWCSAIWNAASSTAQTLHPSAPLCYRPSIMASRCGKPDSLFSSCSQIHSDTCHLVSGEDFIFFMSFLPLKSEWIWAQERPNDSLSSSMATRSCPPLPLAHFPGSKSWDKDGTGWSTKHESKITGVWVTVAGSHRDSGSSFCWCCILYWHTKQEELGFYTTF